MSKPAGVQIRQWFGFLVCLLVAVDLTALGGSWLIHRSVDEVARQAQPLATGAHEIRAEIMGAQKDLFRYLAEFTDTPSEVLTHVDRLENHLERLRRGAYGAKVVQEFDEIGESAKRYRKVVNLLPSTAGGQRDWKRLDEMSGTAVQLGGDVEARAEDLAKLANDEIRDRTRDAALATQAAQWTAVGVLLISLATVFLLSHWWRKFQEIILEM